jgi:hypothetical protein
MAEPLEKIKRPMSSSMTIIGNSHHFFRSFKKFQMSLRSSMATFISLILYIFNYDAFVKSRYLPGFYFDFGVCA